MKARQVKFARAVFCAGVDTWYLRFGSKHGIDVMFKMGGEGIANVYSKLINQSLNRDLNKIKK